MESGYIGTMDAFDLFGKDTFVQYVGMHPTISIIAQTVVQGWMQKGKKNVKRGCKMDVFRGLCTSVCRAYANAYGYVREEE